MKKVVLSMALVAMMFVSCKEAEANTEAVEETAVEAVEAVEETAVEAVDTAAAAATEAVEAATTEAPAAH
jgi:PBP1b-binding outer membrane lipoprotein LpoB